MSIVHTCDRDGTQTTGSFAKDMPKGVLCPACEVLENQLKDAMDDIVQDMKRVLKDMFMARQLPDTFSENGCGEVAANAIRDFLTPPPP